MGAAGDPGKSPTGLPRTKGAGRERQGHPESWQARGCTVPCAPFPPRPVIGKPRALSSPELT